MYAPCVDWSDFAVNWASYKIHDDQVSDIKDKEYNDHDEANNSSGAQKTPLSVAN